MSYITKRNFIKLANIRSPHCISIYLPTEQLQRDLNRIKFKNHLKEAREKLEAYDLTEAQINTLTKKAEALLDDEEFWQKLSKGLALFCYDGEMSVFISDQSLASNVYVADHLNLLELVNELNKTKNFYLLVLGANNVRYFNGNDRYIDQLDLDLPTQMEEIVGSDYHQKALHYRSGQGESGGGMYHGQGSSGDSQESVSCLNFLKQLMIG